MTDRYLSDKECIDRLLNEWEKYGLLVIAFDFDNCVFDYHDRGDKYDNVIALLRKVKKMGCHLVCFTSCDDSRFPDIKKYLNDNDIPFDSINETPDFIPFKGRKVYYNILLDDRAGLLSAYTVLNEVAELVTINRHTELQSRRQDVDF
jgi:hypothetical protein